MTLESGGQFRSPRSAEAQADPPRARSFEPAQVVITGLGTVNPLGNNTAAFDAALRAGRSGYGPIQRCETKGLAVRGAYEVKDFSPKSRSSALDPFIRYILAAAREAVNDSALDWPALDRFRIGLSVSSSKGGISTVEKYRGRFEEGRSGMLAAICYASLPPNIAAQWVAKKLNVRGPAICYVAACATGLTAVIEGARLIKEGIVDVCLAGAGDASITPLMLAGYARMKALSRDELRPFARNRTGFGIGEGAGVVVLERRSGAEARGAKIYGELIGTAYGTDIYSPTRFDPDAHALSRTLEKLFAASGITPVDVDYAHLHGTGTVDGDRYEAGEIDRVFGRAPKTSFSAIKSLTGHMLGASGACELIGLLLSMRGGYVPPVTSCVEVDKSLPIRVVREKAKEKNVQIATAHNMGFGGHIAAVAVRNNR